MPESLMFCLANTIFLVSLFLVATYMRFLFPLDQWAVIASTLKACAMIQFSTCFKQVFLIAFLLNGIHTGSHLFLIEAKFQTIVQYPY